LLLNYIINMHSTSPTVFQYILFSAADDKLHISVLTYYYNITEDIFVIITNYQHTYLS